MRLRQRRRLLDVARLRHVPQDQLDVARAAAEDRQWIAVGVRDALGCVAILVETEVEHFRAGGGRSRRRIGMQADEQVGLVVVRHRGALVKSDGRVAVAGENHAEPQAVLRARLSSRRATLSVTCFSSVPDGPLAPSSVPPCPASMTIARSAPEGREVDEWRALRRGRNRSETAAARSVVCATMSMTSRDGASIRGCIGRPERGEPWPEIDRDRGRAVARPDVDHEIGRGRRRQRGIEHVGFEAHRQSRAFLDDGVRRGRRDVEASVCARLPSGSMRPTTRGARMSPTRISPRRFAKIEVASERRCQCARHEVDRHVPSPSLAHRRGWKRDQSAIERCQALALRERDRLRACGDRQSAGGGVFADDDAEQPCQVVEREHLLAWPSSGSQADGVLRA